jgi:hypothetical protein
MIDINNKQNKFNITSELNKIVNDVSNQGMSLNVAECSFYGDILGIAPLDRFRFAPALVSGNNNFALVYLSGATWLSFNGYNQDGKTYSYIHFDDLYEALNHAQNIVGHKKIND